MTARNQVYDFMIGIDFCLSFEVFRQLNETLEAIKSQGCREGTSCVAFDVLIIKSEIDFINPFIFNCLTSNINLFIFKCLTLNINLFNFNCLTSNFCFPKNIFFASRRERLFMDARPQFRVFNTPGKMMTCYLRDTNKFFRYRTLYTNILKCRFPTKGIQLTRLKFFSGPKGASALRYLVQTILVGSV